MSQRPNLAYAIEEAIAEQYVACDLATYYAVMFSSLAEETEAEKALFALAGVGKLDAFTDYFDADGEQVWTADFDSPIGRGEISPETEPEPDYFEYRFVVSDQWREGLRKKVEARPQRCA